MHIYQDVSHFRAPYKSLLSVAGFGADTIDMAAAWAAMTEVDVNGERWWRLATAKIIWANMASQLCVVQGTPTADSGCFTILDPPVSVVGGFPPQGLIQSGVTVNGAVYASVENAIPSTTSPKLLCASKTPASPGAQFARIYPAPAYLAAVPYTPAAVQPGVAPAGDTDWLENLAIVAGIAVGLGVAAWALKKYSKRGGPLSGKLAVPNKRRPSRKIAAATRHLLRMAKLRRGHKHKVARPSLKGRSMYLVQSKMDWGWATEVTRKGYKAAVTAAEDIAFGADPRDTTVRVVNASTGKVRTTMRGGGTSHI